MGAISGLDDLVNKATGGNNGNPENIWFSRWDRIAGTAITFLQNRYYSLWTFDGQPSAGAVPGAVAVPDNTTSGGLRQTNAGGGRTKWLTSLQNALTNGQGSLLVYDRLLHIGGLSGTVTTAQAVGGALTRYATTEAWGNQVWYEIYSDIGATGTTLTMNYTDQDGNSATSGTAAIGGANFQGAGRAQPIPLASGDLGVRGVTDITLAATTGTSGSFGITIMRPLVELNVAMIGGGGVLGWLENISEIKPSACLSMIWTPHTTGRLGIMGAAATLEA